MRSQWKVPYIHKLFFQKNISKHKELVISLRKSKIPSKFLVKSYRIYNGIWYSSLRPKKALFGRYFGEFSFSRRVGTQKHLKEKRRKKSVTSKRR